MVREKNEQRSGHSFLSSKLVLVAGLAILGLIVFGFGKQIIRKYQVDQEISEIQHEVASLEEQNQELTDLIKYFESETYRDREARSKLNLQKPGERVVVVPEGEIVEYGAPAGDNTPESDEETVIDVRTNPERWWDYFFAGANNGE